MSSPSLREIRWSKGLVLGHFVSKNYVFEDRMSMYWSVGLVIFSLCSIILEQKPK